MGIIMVLCILFLSGHGLIYDFATLSVLERIVYSLSAALCLFGLAGLIHSVIKGESPDSPFGD